MKPVSFINCGSILDPSAYASDFPPSVMSTKKSSGVENLVVAAVACFPAYESHVIFA